MLISDIHYIIVIGCGGELSQSDCLYVGEKGAEGMAGTEGAEGMEGTEGMEGAEGTESTEGMTYIKAL